MKDNKLALLVHGFNVSDRGVSTIGRLRWFFSCRGWDVINFDMGWMGLIQVRTQNRKHAEKLAKAAKNFKVLYPESPVVAVGHSNGCAVIHIATTQFRAPIDRVAYINPALDNTSAPGPFVKACSVWHSPSDKPVKVARWLPAHDWGDMGAVGYRGDDKRVQNFNKEEDMLIVSKAHSDFADEDKLSYFGSIITNDLIGGYK